MGIQKKKNAFTPNREGGWSHLSGFCWIISLGYVYGQFDVNGVLPNCVIAEGPEITDWKNIHLKE